MKSLFRSFAQVILQLRAEKVLRRAETIIGVTGSIGKSSTRMAIADVLRKRYSVLTSQHNFNTPIGLLLSIVGIDQSGNSFFSWVKIIIKALFIKLPAPQVLVLEYGIDAPKDMEKLLEIAIPDIVVLTPISIAHTDAGQFTDVDHIREEKLKLALSAKRTVIVNAYDAETTKAIRGMIPQSVRIFGEGDRIHVPVKYMATQSDGIHFTVDEEEYSARVFGEFQPQIFAPAIMLGKEMGVETEDIKSAISAYEPPAGRGRIFAGKHGCTLWDFTYNSSPSAVLAALSALPNVPGFARRIAVLGNMNELGKHSQYEHKRFGIEASKNADIIFFVGKEAEAFISGITEKEKVRIFPNAQKAGEYLCDFVKRGDLLLVKGSQNGVFLEAAVEMLLEHKEDAARLCRYSEHWNTVRKKYFESCKV